LFQAYIYYLSYQAKKSLEFSKNPEIVFTVFPVVSIYDNSITAIVFIEPILGNPFFWSFPLSEQSFLRIESN